MCGQHKPVCLWGLLRSVAPAFNCEQECPDENNISTEDTNKYSDTTERCCYVECYEGSRSALSLMSDTSGIVYIPNPDIRFQFNPVIVTSDHLAC